MPRRSTHQPIGALSAGAVALARSRDLPKDVRWVYCLAATAAGYALGTLPDILEPAVHSHHRDVCHSLTGAVTVAVRGAHAAKESGTKLLREGAQFRAGRLALPTNDPERPAMAAAEYFRYALVGFVLGAVVAYVAHVVADMGTPRGVPLLARKVA